MKKELIGIIVCILLVGVSVSPILSAESISLFKEEVRNDNNCIQFNQEGIFDII